MKGLLAAGQKLSLYCIGKETLSSIDKYPAAIYNLQDMAGAKKPIKES
ncbi:hypothetical protein [Acidaminococcus timonensis]|nr:hypothetical protein [Acidaminococcus timonensis]